MKATIDHGLSKAQLLSIKNILNQCTSRIDRVSLFGSRAKGTYKNYSDIDLVLYGDISDRQVDRLWTDFYESNLPYKVDINAYQSISYPPLKRHIDHFSRTLFTKNDLKRGEQPD